MEIVLYTLIGLIIGGAIALVIAYFILKPKSKVNDEVLLQTLELKIKAMMPELINESSENLIKIANEKLGAEKKEIRADMESKRSEMTRMVQQIERQLKNNEDKLAASDKERIGSFNALKERLEEQTRISEQLRVSTENLKKVLSNNQMRGHFGEQVAEDLLKMSGFVVGKDYEFNKAQETRETRPDFTIYMPDRTKINVDAKFPYANLQKLAETENEEQQKEYRKLFEKDVKDKIKQVTVRDYINPEEGTVDFVIVFIPNEMIFSWIYDQMNEIWVEAMRKKVIFAGPFSFTAILRMVRQAYDNFEIKGNIREIIGHVKAFSTEFAKFDDEFQKVGDRIQALDKQFATVNSTRMNQLRRKMDRVQMLEEPVEESTSGESDTIKMIE
ncbi:MAG: DNA recombination protein RmuC [Candidatus Dojkabacteria bacterium]|nr:MAG: DNA recombination protein RmuC [Candidatus Dojkabacteria bacterium]